MAEAEEKPKVEDIKSSPSSPGSDATSVPNSANPSVASSSAVKPEKKEKTTKGMTNLILEQIRSLIEINIALNTKIKDIIGKQDGTDKNIKKIEESVKGFDDRITKLENNMEKFIGLYEMVTNKYNPFLEDSDKSRFNVSQKDVFEGIDLEKLKNDAKKIILDIKNKQGLSSNGKVTDDLSNNIDSTFETVPKDISYPEEELQKNTGVSINKPNLNNFGNVKKSSEQDNTVATPVAEKPSVVPDLEEYSAKFHFMLKDGRTVKSLKELAMLLDDMPQEIFSHHFDSEKNDFYEWIKHCINPDFAESMKNEKTKEGLKLKLIELLNKK